jgi:hypothetical protein
MAPTTKPPAEAKAAWIGRAIVLSGMSSSSRSGARNPSFAIS